MAQKKIYLFILIFFIIIVWLITPKECVKKDFWTSIDNLGYGIIKSCYTEYKIKNSIKQKLSNNKLIYNIAAKLKVTFFRDFGKSRDLNYSVYKGNGKKTSYHNDDIVKNIKALTNQEIFKISNNYKNKPNINKKFQTWKRSHANNWNNKFFDTNLVNVNNIENLELLWKFRSNDLNNNSLWKENIGANPVFDNGILYFLSSDWSLNAINVVTGKLVWKKNFLKSPGRRGYLLNKEKDKIFLYITSGGRLFKIDGKNGLLEKSFGDSGSISVGSILAAPIIYKNEIILLNVRKLKILSYSTHDGDLISNKPIHPKNEKHYATPWSGVALDNETGYLFFVTGNPKPDLYGVHRPGKNLNSNSLIAYDLNDKKIVWSFQETAHDLWDFDLSAPPILGDINYKDNLLKVVIITAKTGNTFVFERNSGKSLFDINYKITPKSNIPGEFTSKYQIYNTLPERFSRTEFKLEDLRKRFLDNEKFLEEFKKKNIWGWFEPPTLGKELVLNGIHGGSNWFGSSFDQKNKIIYIPSSNIPFKIEIYLKSIKQIEEKSFPENLKKVYQFYNNNCSTCHKKNRNGNYESVVNKINEKITNKIPSIVGLTKYEALKHKIYNYEYFIQNHNFLKKNINKKQHSELIKLFEFWDNFLFENDEMNFEGYWAKYIADDNMLITKPPWGEIIALNIENGKIIWKKPFGYKEINSKEEKLGTYHNGGLSSTSSGIIFANGTIDSYAIALDSKTGDEIWKYKMDAPGSAPPILFSYNGKFYASFVSTGLPYYNSVERDFSIYTFGIK